MEELLTCVNKSHNTLGSLYPKDGVPRELFLSDPEDPNSKLRKQCFDCRKYRVTVSRRYDAKLRVKTTASRTANTDVMTCSSRDHPSKSKYPRDAVPRDMFKRYPDDPNSPLTNSCSDCKAVKAVEWTKRMEKLEEEIKNHPGKFVCSTCHTFQDESLRSTRKDGTPGASCLECKETTRLRTIQVKREQDEIKLSFMMIQEASCYKCRSLYVHDPDDYLKFTKHQTFERDGNRYIQVGDGEMLVTEILQTMSEYLAYDILEFDHLPEAEQRARGLLKPNEEYSGKIKRVSNLSSKMAKESEARKCQLLCARCHLLETIDREIGEYTRHEAYEFKITYVNELKATGCEMCGYIELDLPRFFHLDHLDPSTKIESVALMAKEGKWSMKQLKDECAKCRVLCAHCHKLVTQMQRKAGII